MCTACHVTRFAARCSRRMRPLAVATVPAAVEVGDGLARAGAAAGSGVWRLCRGARRDLARRSVHFSLGPNSWQRGLVSAPSVCRRCRRTRLCSRSAADPRAPARRRHWAGAPRLPPRLARAAGAGPGTSHVEVAPFLPFQEHRPRTAAYVAMQEPNAKEPNAKELVALRPVVAPRRQQRQQHIWRCGPGEVNPGEPAAEPWRVQLSLRRGAAGA